MTRRDKRPNEQIETVILKIRKWECFRIRALLIYFLPQQPSPASLLKHAQPRSQAVKEQSSLFHLPVLFLRQPYRNHTHTLRTWPGCTRLTCGSATDARLYRVENRRRLRALISCDITVRIGHHGEITTPNEMHHVVKFNYLQNPVELHASLERRWIM